MKLFVIRHGQTNYNVEHLCNDDPTTDVHLTKEGENQARLVAEELKNINFDRVFISEIPRTRETAKIIKTDAIFTIDKRINDRKTGFEGKSTYEFYDLMKADLFNKKLPSKFCNKL